MRNINDMQSNTPLLLTTEAAIQRNRTITTEGLDISSTNPGVEATSLITENRIYPSRQIQVESTSNFNVEMTFNFVKTDQR